MSEPTTTELIRQVMERAAAAERERVLAEVEVIFHRLLQGIVGEDDVLAAIAALRAKP